jgi:hypothetical protein
MLAVRALLLLSMFTFLAVPAAAFADKAPEWKEVSNEEGIKVWQREVPGTSFVEFRGQGDINSGMKMILAVLHDHTKKKEWMNRCVENRLVRAKATLGNNVMYNRTGSNVPFVSDRDAVLESTLTILREKKQVQIDVKNVTDPLAPEVDGVVRMPKLFVQWLLEYKDAKTTKVTYTVQADPGGMLPAWIVNMVSKEMPAKTIANLREQVKKPGYDKDLMFVEAAYDWSGIE